MERALATRRRRACAAISLLLLLVPGESASESPAVLADVGGRVTIGLEGAEFGQLGPIVVYLEPLDAPLPAAPRGAVEIRQKNAHFAPAFQVVAVGQPVEMKNVDAIYHNVFSYSRPNDFDLGTYPAGESRTVTFSHPGVVRTYCSIHENMNGTIVVVPTRHYDVVDGSGHFLIGGVAAGGYRLHVWTEKLPRVSRDVTVKAGVDLELELSLLGT
jgi:plastocyanin